MHVTARDLGHRFGDGSWLFQNLNFDLGPGVVCSLTGPSGSGKSSLLGILAGWIRPMSGTLTRPGVTNCGWVFQNPVGVARRTAVDHVALPYLARGLDRPDAQRRAAGILDTFGLASVAGSAFGQLSGGEAQRLMLARAVATQVDLLLVDEPTAQLDQDSAGTVIDVLQNLAQDDTIVVIASHDPRVRLACSQAIALGAL